MHNEVLRAKLDQLETKMTESLIAGGEERLKKQESEGRLSARKRLDVLLDPGSFVELDRFVVHKCKNFGMEELFDKIESHRIFLSKSGALREKRKYFAKTALMNIVRDTTTRSANTFFNGAEGQALIEKVADRKLDPFSAARSARVIVTEEK